MTSVTIRRGRPEDTDRVNSLYVSMLRSIYGWNQVEDDECCCGPESFRHGMMSTFFVAETPEKVVGFVKLMPMPMAEGDGLYIDAICVSDTMRGKGVGTALLRQAETFLQQSGGSMLLLHVENSNKNARRLYERVGYVRLEKENGRILMMKVLADGEGSDTDGSMDDPEGKCIG